MYLLKTGLRPGPGMSLGKQAQVSLEIAFALIGIFLLLFGALNVFIWVNERLVLRQEDYESSRKSASISYESAYPALDIFKGK